MQILIIAAFSYWFAALSGVPQYISKVLFNFGLKREIGTGYLPIRLYPLDCEKCLAFWLSIICFWWEDWFVIISGVTSLVSMVIGYLINKIR